MKPGFFSVNPAMGCGLLVVAVLLHLGLALGFRLSPDEAHYALYAYWPALSYYDHPPLVGWVQIPFVAMGGHDALVRVVPMLCWLATACWLAFRLPFFLKEAGWLSDSPGLVRVQEGSLASAGWVAVVLLVSAPLLHLLGVALVPDALLMPLSLLVLELTLRLCNNPQPLRLWVGLGLVLGLCGLSKYTAVFLGIGAGLTLGLVHGWGLLARRGFWLALVLALLCIAPVVVWNAQNQWMSFAYQGQHAAGTQVWKPGRVLATLLIQVVCYGPLLAVAACMGARHVWKETRQTVAPTHTGRRLFLGLMAFVLPPLLTVLLLSGRGSSLPHWTAYMWVLLIPLAVVGWYQLAVWWRGVLLAFQGLCVMLLVGMLVWGGPFAETGSQATALPGDKAGRGVNPITDLYGWELAARDAQSLAQAHGVGKLAVMNWALGSRLAWYARPWPVVLVQPRRDQFAIWYGTLRPGDQAIVTDFSPATQPAPVGPGKFVHCRVLGQTPVVHGGRQLSHFTHQLCTGWQEVGSVSSLP
jgi:4-amino-4-deoxy-L-arabinose transferase-like glycosyltransferase